MRLHTIDDGVCNQKKIFELWTDIPQLNRIEIESTVLLVIIPKV